MVAEEEEETKTSDVEEAEEVKEISDMENKAKNMNPKMKRLKCGQSKIFRFTEIRS